ncbi:MAG: helix-turn-helix domain-containing protein [Prosthecobacter sp.]
MNTIWYDKPEEDPFYIALGVAVQRRRKDLHLTQQELADAAGISRAEVQFIENAKRRETLQTMRRCCRALGNIWLSELFTEVERRYYQLGHGGPIVVA